MLEILILTALAFAAGIMNSVAGGGALLTFPYLISIGAPAITANASISVGIFGGQASSAFGYRRYLKGKSSILIPLGLLSIVGGLTGAALLNATSESSFKETAPWFVLFGAAMIAAQPYIRRLIQKAPMRTSSGLRVLGYTVGVSLYFASTVYGGYFGAGIGVLIFAILSLSGLFSDVHTINGVKNLLAIAINLSANTYFILSGMVSFKYASAVFIGSIFGGYIGARNATKLSPSVVRMFVILVGIIAFVVLKAK